MGASAQSIKCGIDTKALMAEEVAAGAQSLRFLAKMVPGFDRGALEKTGITVGAQAGDIVTLRVPVESLEVLESSKDILLYSISHRVAAPDCDNMRYDTRTDKVQEGIGVDGDTIADSKAVEYLETEAVSDSRIGGISAIYTIDDLEAREFANIIKPKVVIPMHYKTAKLKMELCGLAPFVDAAKDCRIHNMNDWECTIQPISLGEDRVIVLRPYDPERDEEETR